MLLEKKEIQIEITHTNVIQVRTATIISKDEKELSRTYHRTVYTPISDVSACDQKIQDIAKVIWTDEVKEAYRQSIVEALK